jgi:5-methylcytosine-specific restriction endonuclease McrA
MTVAELMAHAERAASERAARAERLREQKAKNWYSSFEWRKVRYTFLRSQPKPLRCGACGRGVADGAVLCVDHVKSVKLYPQLKTSLLNLQILCRDCNTAKGSEWTDDWRASSNEQTERTPRKENNHTLGDVDRHGEIQPRCARHEKVAQK